MSALASPLASPMGSTLKAYPLSTGVFGMFFINGKAVTINNKYVDVSGVQNG